ncbi:hypothetical protein M407DRAFT_27268 [Tulasnella calospora MUT 4182]|uniref:Uncharacterized protein n=1 Tax=Tulasnella calospora MUT 4182 TaxID=1051891 RepID=A0A0C3QCP1_9AGAM|nr:hypothetical protein M407DRAFT_27268 [Tulasnella calospora MUT 4182]
MSPLIVPQSPYVIHRLNPTTIDNNPRAILLNGVGVLGAPSPQSAHNIRLQSPLAFGGNEHSALHHISPAARGSWEGRLLERSTESSLSAGMQGFFNAYPPTSSFKHEPAHSSPVSVYDHELA